jgi:hypothetical protein
MVGARLGITLVLVTAVLFQQLRDQMHYAVVVLIAVLLFLAVQSNQSRTRRLRDQTIVDLAVFLVVVPALVLTGFVAAQTGSLLPAERSALIEISIAAFIALSVLVLFCYRVFGDDRPMMAVAMLPGMLIVVSLTFVLHEYRNQTVLAMIAVSYFIAAVAVGLGTLVEEPVRRYVPATFYGFTVLVGIALFDPGTRNIGERESIIQVILWGLVGLGLITLIVVPSPWFQPARMLAGLVEGYRQPGRSVGRRNNDPVGRTED